MPSPAVEVRGLVKRYGDLVAVDGLDLTVDRGGVTAVLGPNGAGKTTTLETCEGYRTADAGEVRVLGLDPRADAAALHTRVGVMLQSGGVYPTVRVEQAFRHASALYAHPLDVDALVERLGLGRLRRQVFKRLSGGEQQRVRLGLALVGRPELVFLDEPTAGLDPQARHAVWDLVRQLRADGVTVVLTTHYLEEGEELADRVVIVDRGRVVADGAPAELTADGAESLTFSGPMHLDLDGLVRALPEGITAVEDPPGRYRLRGHLDAQVLAGVTAWCAQHRVEPRDLQVRRRSLEDVFLELTGRELRA